MDFGHYRMCFFLCAFGLLQACAIHLHDEDGTERIIGLVNLRLSPTNTSETFAGRITDIQAAGVGIIQSDSGMSLNLGYTRERVGYLKNHAIVIGDPQSELRVITETKNE